MQLLENGDTFVGWGAEPYFSEYSASGQLLFDAHLHGSYESYRSYRFPWIGAPGLPPSVAVTAARSAAPHRLRELERRHPHRQLARCSPAPRPTARARRHRRARRLRDRDRLPSRERYVSVRALDAAGAVLGSSQVFAG